MKTIIGHLCPNDKFSQVRADQMCLDLKNYAKVQFVLSDDETRALYRFAVLTFTYMDKECNREDFSILSFFKLLYCEVRDPDFRDDEGQSIYDILISDAIEHGHDIIYMMSKYWEDAKEHMPDNADEMYQFALKKFCIKNDIEFYDDDMVNAKKSYDEREKRSNNPSDTADEDAFDIDTLLEFFALFEDYRKTGNVAYFDEAEEAIEEFEANTTKEMNIYTHLVKIMNEYRAYVPVIQAIKKHF